MFLAKVWIDRRYTSTNPWFPKAPKDRSNLFSITYKINLALQEIASSLCLLTTRWLNLRLSMHFSRFLPYFICLIGIAYSSPIPAPQLCILDMGMRDLENLGKSGIFVASFEIEWIMTDMRELLRLEQRCNVSA